MQTALNMPLFAGRSKKNFGLNLRMDIRFFHETSSEGKAGRTKNPTPIVFRKYERDAFELRDKLFKSSACADHTPKEKMAEWVSIMSDVRQFATEQFVKSTAFGGDFVPYNDAMKGAAIEVALRAKIHLEGLISLRIGTNGAAVNHKPTPSLNLPIKQLPIIYVVRDQQRDGKHHCKIGFTEDLNQRLSQFKTSNPAIKLLMTINSGPVVTERAVQSLFRHKHEILEWFWLDDADLQTLMNPAVIRRKILEAA